MEPAVKDLHAAALGQRGELKRMQRLSKSDWSQLAKHAAHARWHPREAQTAKEKAVEIAYLVQEALKHPRQH